MKWLGYKNLTHCYVSPLFWKSSIVSRLGRRILLSMSKYNPVKSNELNRCYLIDKLLNPRRSCILDIDWPIPSTEGGRRKSEWMPELPLQAAPEIKDSTIWCIVKFPLCSGVHGPDYVGASHIYGCRGYFFLHKFI